MNLYSIRFRVKIEKCIDINLGIDTVYFLSKNLSSIFMDEYIINRYYSENSYDCGVRIEYQYIKKEVNNIQQTPLLEMLLKNHKFYDFKIKFERDIVVWDIGFENLIASKQFKKIIKDTIYDDTDYQDKINAIEEWNRYQNILLHIYGVVFIVNTNSCTFIKLIFLKHHEFKIKKKNYIDIVIYFS